VTPASLQRAPEDLLYSEVKVTERQEDLTNGVVSAEAVIVEYLQMECARHEFLIGKLCKTIHTT
jgi:hypothetical protein